MSRNGIRQAPGITRNTHRPDKAGRAAPNLMTTQPYNKNLCGGVS